MLGSLWSRNTHCNITCFFQRIKLHSHCWTSWYEIISSIIQIKWKFFRRIPTLHSTLSSPLRSCDCKWILSDLSSLLLLDDIRYLTIYTCVQQTTAASGRVWHGFQPAIQNPGDCLTYDAGRTVSILFTLYEMQSFLTFLELGLFTFVYLVLPSKWM